MNEMSVRINSIINSLEPEYRIPVLSALSASDGTVISFQQELAAQAWDNPDLPIQQIFDAVCWDVA
jgi:hypothetical protein